MTNISPNILLIGSTGQLGTTLHLSLASLGTLTAWNRTDLDLSKPEIIREKIHLANPDLIINTAAYTAVDRAESESELAHTINATAVHELAKAAQELNCPLIHYSTDYVFDGTKKSPYLETDVPHPINVYGKSKLLGEEFLQTVHKKHIILRTSWVYSNYGHNFLKTMLRLSKEKSELSIVKDQIGSPTSCDCINAATLTIVQKILSTDFDWNKCAGIYHLTTRGETSWHDFAKEIFEKLNIDIKLHAITTEQYPTPAQRPKYSVLDLHKLERVFGIQTPSWQSCVASAVTLGPYAYNT